MLTNIPDARALVFALSVILAMLGLGHVALAALPGAVALGVGLVLVLRFRPAVATVASWAS